MAIEESLSIEEIIRSYPKEYIKGIRAKKGATNPYEPSFHFELTINDCKLIAWREGYNLMNPQESDTCKDI